MSAASAFASAPSQVDLANLISVLLCNGVLRKHYKDTNRTEPSVQQITHHGWIHIVMVVMVARVLGPIFKLLHYEQGLVELACLFHDIGLSKGRKRHAINGAAMVESILAPMGVDPQTIEIVRLLVRFHRAEDFVWLSEQILPRWQFVLERIEAGDEMWNLVKTNNPDEDPSEEEIRRFLQLERDGVRMIHMLSALMIADLSDIGRSRVRAKRRKIFNKYLRAAEQRPRYTVEDALKANKRSYSPFDLANFAITKMSVVVQDDNGDTILKLNIQEEIHYAHQARSKRRKSRAGRTCSWAGLFLWARSFAQILETNKRMAAIDLPSFSWFERGNGEGQPANIILRGIHHREVCSAGRVEEIKADYLSAFGHAAHLLNLTPLTEIRSTVNY
jgi:hypothetical protein